MKCESCNGTGKYIGFTTFEESCKYCLGKGIIETSINKSSFIKIMISLSDNSLMESIYNLTDNLTDEEKDSVCHTCELLRYAIHVVPRPKGTLS